MGGLLRGLCVGLLAVLLVSGRGLAAESLSDLIPLTKEVSALKGFVTDHVTKTDQQLKVTGALQGTTITVVKELKDSTGFAVTAEHLALQDIFPAAADLPFLHDFSISYVGYVDRVFSVKGTLSGKDAAVSESKVAGKTAITVTADHLTVPDVIPAAGELGFLGRFSLTAVDYSDHNLTVRGTLFGKGAAVSESKVAGKAAISVTADALTLPDLVPAAGELKFLGQFSFTAVDYSDHNLTVRGTLFGKDVAVSEAKESGKNVVTVTANHLTLADVVPAAGELGFLGGFSFTAVTYSDHRISVSGIVAGKDVTVTEQIPQKGTAEKSVVTVSSDQMTMQSVIPETAQVDSIKSVNVETMSYSDRVFTVTGSIGGKTVTLTETGGVVTLQSKGLVLGNLVGWLGGFPILNDVAFDRLVLTKTYLEGVVTVSGESVSITANFNKKFLALYFGDKLTLSSFLPTNNKVINQLALGNTLFVISDAKDTTVEPNDLAEDLRGKVDFGASQKMVCAAGLNLNAKVNNLLSEGFKKLGAATDKIPGKLPLKGILSKQTFDILKDGVKSIKPAEVLKEIDLTMDLSPLSVKIAKMDLHDFSASIGPDATGNDAEFAVHAQLNHVKASAKADLDDNNHVVFELSIDGPVKLSDLAPQIPHGNQFKLDELKIASNGIEAQSKVLGLATDIYLFELGDALVFAGDLTVNAQGKFSLGKLAEAAGLTGTKKDLIQSSLNGLLVADAALIVSSKSLGTVNAGMLKSSIARDMFAKIFGKLDIPVTIGDVTFLSDFDLGQMGKIGGKLQQARIGLSGNGLMNGTVGGLYDGNPLSLDLELLMAGALDTTNLNLPKIFTRNPKELGGGVKEGVFLKVLDETAEIGLLAGFDVSVNNVSAGLTGSFGVQLDEEGGELSLTGTLNDDLNNAFGVPDFKLTGVTVNTSISADSISFGIEGSTEYLGRNMTVADNLKFTSEGVPKGFGFTTTIDKLDTTGWILVDRTFILAAPTLAGGAVGAVGGGLVGGIIGGVCDVPTGAVPGALVLGAIGVVGGGVAGTAIGGAIGAGAEVIIPQSLVETVARKEAFILQADAAYISFATPGAESVDLKIPPGVHFNMDNVRFFGQKIVDIKPDIGWILKIQNDLSKAAGGIEKVEADAKKKIGQEARKVKKDVEHGAADAVNDAKKMASNVLKLNKVLLYELGMTKTKPAFAYTRPSVKDLETFKKEMSFSVKNLKLGGVQLTDLEVALIPSLHIKSKANLLGNECDLSIDFTDKGLEFTETVDLEGLGKTNVTFVYDKDHDAFNVEGKVDPSALEPLLRKEISLGMTQFLAAAKKAHQGVVADFQKGEAAVSGAQSELETARQKEAEFIDTVDRVVNGRRLISQAQNELDSVQGKIDSKCSYLRKSPFHAESKCKNGLSYLFSEARKSVQQAEDALKDAINSVQIPKDLSDKFTQKQAALDHAVSELTPKKALVDAINGVDQIMEGTLKSAVSKFNGTSFSVQQVVLAGGMPDPTGKGPPLILEMNYTLSGEKREDAFAFKLKDDAYNATSFALLPAMALESVIRTDLGKEPATLTNWLLAFMDAQMVQIKGRIAKDIGAQHDRYGSVLTSLETGTSGLQSAHNSFLQAHSKIMYDYTFTDMMPPSSEYRNVYLAVGHSALCLGVAPNGVDVYQEACNDTDADRWGTSSLGNGYVQLKNKGLCLKARNADSSSGQPLVLAQCNKQDDHEQWKIISTDGFFDKVVNRFSQKCLHFDTENANPETAYATWTSCLGADSQTFRDLADAEKPKYYKVEAQITAQNGRCMAPVPGFESYFTKSAKGHPTTSKKAYDDMRKRKDNVLMSVSCQEGPQARFNYVEMVDGDMKLVHGYSGWCVVPQSKHDTTLVLKPCNRNKNMLWRTVREGGAFMMKNTKDNKCITLENGSDSREPNVVANIGTCAAKPEQSIKFVK